MKVEEHHSGCETCRDLNNQVGRRRDELGGATGHGWLGVDQTQVQA